MWCMICHMYNTNDNMQSKKLVHTSCMRIRLAISVRLRCITDSKSRRMRSLTFHLFNVYVRCLICATFCRIPAMKCGRHFLQTKVGWLTYILACCHLPGRSLDRVDARTSLVNWCVYSLHRNGQTSCFQYWLYSDLKN